MAVINVSQPDELVISRYGSPIVVGQDSDNSLFIRSEVSAFSKFTKDFIETDQNELICLKLGQKLLLMNTERAKKAT